MGVAFSIWSQTMTKEEIMQAIKALAAELGRAPSMPELRDKTGITPRQVRRNFLTFTAALKACGPRGRR